MREPPATRNLRIGGSPDAPPLTAPSVASQRAHGSPHDVPIQARARARAHGGPALASRPAASKTRGVLLPSATGAAPIRRHSAAAAATDKFQVTATAAVVAAIADAVLGYQATTGDPSSRGPTAEEGPWQTRSPSPTPTFRRWGCAIDRVTAKERRWRPPRRARGWISLQYGQPGDGQ